MTTATENLKNLKTPRELELRKILSQTTQWRERNAGRLKFYRIGNKIFYSGDQIEAFFRLNEGNAEAE